MAATPAVKKTTTTKAGGKKKTSAKKKGAGKVRAANRGAGLRTSLVAISERSLQRGAHPPASHAARSPSPARLPGPLLQKPAAAAPAAAAPAPGGGAGLVGGIIGACSAALGALKRRLSVAP